MTRVLTQMIKTGDRRLARTGGLLRGTRRDHADPSTLTDRKYLERRVFGCNGPDLVVARVWPGALEEDPDLCLPPSEVGAQHRYLLIVGELPAAEALRAPPDPQLAGADGAQVTHPLSLPAGCDEVTAAVVGEQVHRRGPPLSARPALHRQDPRAENADALPGKEGHQLVEHVAREPAGRTVVIGHAASVATRCGTGLADGRAGHASAGDGAR